MLIEHIMDLKLRCLAKESVIMGELGLTSSEFNALLSFEEHDKLSCKAAAARMGLSESRASRVLNKLIEKSLFNISYPGDDSRTVRISLSPKGSKLRKKIIKELIECDSEIKSKLTKGELDDLISVLIKVNRILGDIHHERNFNGTSYNRFVQTKSI